MIVVALLNKKVPYWNPPVFATGTKEEIRNGLFRYCISNVEDARKAHYDECELYYLGTFDDQRCRFDLLEVPEFLFDLREAFKDECRDQER